MKNERIIFIKSAIAAAISSSFIYTAALGNEPELEAYTWDAKTSVFHSHPTNIEFRQTEENQFRQPVIQPLNYNKRNMPYLETLSDELKKSGVDILVETKDSDNGLKASSFVVRIQKGGEDAFLMERDIENGQTTIALHEKLTEERRLNKNIADFWRKKAQKDLMISNNAIAPPDAVQDILNKLADREHPLSHQSENKYKQLIIQTDGETESPKFINSFSTGSELPDAATMVDIDGAIAVMMTAFMHTQFKQQANLEHSDENTKKLLASMLVDQPGFMVGAKDVSDLAKIKHAPVFLIRKTDRQIELMQQPATAHRYLKLHQYNEQSDQADYKDITLSKTAIEDLRETAYRSQLQQLVMMLARNKHSNTLPGKMEIQKLASDQELLFLCDAKLKHEKAKSITLTSDEQRHAANLIDPESLLTYLRDQFMKHPTVGHFVMDTTLKEAVTEHLTNKVVESAPDGLNYLYEFKRYTYPQKKEQVNVYRETHNNKIEKLNQEYNELNKVNNLIKTYAKDSGYDTEQFAKQKELEDIHKKIIALIKNTELPEFSQVPAKDTPSYDQLKEKLKTMATARNKKETREQIEGWNNEPIIEVTDQLHKPLHNIIKAELPDIVMQPGNKGMPDLKPLIQLLEQSSSHDKKELNKEKEALGKLLDIKDPKAFQEEFDKYSENRDDLESYNKIHKNMLELRNLVAINTWDEKNKAKALEIISPWVEDAKSESAEQFNQYLAKNTDGVLDNFRNAFDNQGDEVTVKSSIKDAMDLEIAKEAINIGTIRQKLSATNKELQKLNDLHEELLTIKEVAEKEATTEIEGMSSIKDQLEAIDEESKPDEVLEVIKNLKPSGANDDQMPLNQAWKMVHGVTQAAVEIRKQAPFLGGDDDGDIDLDYLHTHRQTIDKFKEDCEKCSSTEAWKKIVNQQPDDLTDEYGYPHTDKLQEIKEQTEKTLDEIEQKRFTYNLWQADPDDTYKKHKKNQLKIEKLEEEKKALQEEVANQPLPAEKEKYIHHYLELEPGSKEAIMLGDLLRLAKAGVPEEAFEKLGFNSQIDATILTALTTDKDAPSDEIKSITHRLVTNREHIDPMLEKLGVIKAIEAKSHREILNSILIESSKTADQDLTNLSETYHKATMALGSYNEFAIPFIKAYKEDPGLFDEVLASLQFYAKNKKDDPAELLRREKLDKLGLTLEKSEALIKLITRSPQFKQLNDEQIIKITLLDMTSAELSRYDEFGYKVRQSIAAMRRYASNVAQRLNQNAQSTQRWLKDSGYSATVASYDTLQNLLYLYARNRLNVYLDDIAYNNGRGLIAAINDTGEGLDEFLLAAGLVRGEHQQQVVSDILNYFGNEAIRVYDERFRHILGERADFMDNVLKPTALAVQAPVGFQEIGAVLKLGGEGNVWSWNTAWHAFGYTAIGIIVDLTRGNQYNKMMIQAIDPAMTNFAEWMDGKAHHYSDQASPEDKYYSELWSSTVKHWNGWHDYLGQTHVAKVGRPFAEVAQSWITTKIYGAAFVPLLNAKTYAITNPGLRANMQPEVPYWKPGIRSVITYHIAKEIFYDWAYNDLTNAKYGLEGFAGIADHLNGVPTTEKNSWSQWVEKDLHKLSLSSADTRFAEGKDLASWTPYTNVVKSVATDAARVGQITGLNKLAGFSRGTYDQFGKPDFADQVRRSNTVSSWMGTLSEYSAWALKKSRVSSAILWSYDKLEQPVKSVLSTAASGLSTAAGGITSAAIMSKGKWQSVENRLYESLGYQQVNKSGSDQPLTTGQSEKNEAEVIDQQTIGLEQIGAKKPPLTENNEDSITPTPDLQSMAGQGEKSEANVIDQKPIAFEQVSAKEPPVTDSEVSIKPTPDLQSIAGQGEMSENNAETNAPEEDEASEGFYGDDDDDDYDYDDEPSNEDNYEEGDIDRPNPDVSDKPQ
ncbi:MlaD family protein [Endozoicomonas euniceicola]|uniref:Uncharacterized protein n=1 Tax=Endozoicomonas euniceicola TaxID=1234143 RepID=A0ABY6GSG7_9GAMM|nr:hypothetical protein [Endozoicomonas euniceicola]UYM15028.1 hypothetical protein NX720_19460 [Endozoicomonas euniceicola]